MKVVVDVNDDEMKKQKERKLGKTRTVSRSTRSEL